MRKKLSLLMATIMVLTLMAAGPAPAQVEPPQTVTVCILVPFGLLFPDGTDIDFEAGQTAELPTFLAIDALVNSGLIARGPCPEGGNGGGGDNGGGGGGGGNGGGGNGGAGPLEITQESEQELESGDVDQSFTVTSEGDNSTQCAGVQGVGQTGNTQNQLGLIQGFSEADDFEFDEVGSDVAASPTNTTTCDQQVNQAASASG